MADKQPGPDFRMRLGAEKDEWQTAAKADGIDQLGTWIKQIVRKHIEKQKREKRKS